MKRLILCPRQISLGLILFGLLLLASPAWASIAEVAGRKAHAQTSSSVSSLAVTYAANNTAHNLLILAVQWNSSTAVLTVDDTAGNTWVQAVSLSTGSPFSTIAIFYVADCKAGANTVTVHSTVAADFDDVSVDEFSGAANSNALDVTTTKDIGSTQNPTTDNFTTTVDNDLIVGLISINSLTPDPGAGFTTIFADGTDLTNSEFKLAGVAGAYSAVWVTTGADSWKVIAATFKPSGGAVVPPGSIKKKKYALMGS